QSRLGPPMTLLRTVAQPEDPVAAVAHVIASLLVRLGRDSGELGVGRPSEPVQQQHAPDVEEELPHDGAAEVAVGELDQLDVAVGDAVAEVGEGILVAPLPLYLAGQPEEVRRLPDEVERDVGERDVLLEDGAVTAPFGQPVAQDQAVVPQPEQILEEPGIAHAVSAHGTPRRYSTRTPRGVR